MPEQRLYYGWWIVAGLFAVLTVSSGLTLVATAESAPQVILGAAVLGSTVGNLLMLHPLWLADGFGASVLALIVVAAAGAKPARGDRGRASC